MMDIIVLAVLGMALLAAEVFVPGGIAGLIGMACLVGVVIVGFIDYGSQAGMLILSGVFLFLLVGIGFWAKYFHLTPIARALTDKGVISGATINDRSEELMGQEGVALSALRPCGMAKINGTRVDVVAESGLIEKGESVRVVAVEGFRVVVRHIMNSTKSEDSGPVQKSPL